MFTTLKSRLQAIIPDDARNQTDPEENPNVSLLRRTLADLKTNVEDSTNGTASGKPNADQTVTAEDEAADDVVDAACRFIAEHRQTAEALLRELTALEERVKEQADISKAVHEYAAAKEKAAEAAAQEQQAKESAAAASTHHAALLQERKDADAFVEPARAEVQTATSQVADLERRLRDAQQAAAAKRSELEKREAHARECAERERAAQTEATETAARVAACHAASSAAAAEAQTAGERAAALRAKFRAEVQSFMALGGVHELAARIAGASAALTTDCSPNGR